MDSVFVDGGKDVFPSISKLITLDGEEEEDGELKPSNNLPLGPRRTEPLEEDDETEFCELLVRPTCGDCCCCCCCCRDAVAPTGDGR